MALEFTPPVFTRVYFAGAEAMFSTTVPRSRAILSVPWSSARFQKSVEGAKASTAG